MRTLKEVIPVNALDKIESATPGLYDTSVMHIERGRVIPDKRLSEFGRLFLKIMENALDDVGVDLTSYSNGGMYYRVLDLSKRNHHDRGGRFHYDARRASDALRKESGPLRIVSALTSDEADISNVFTDNSDYYGKYAGDIIEQGVSDLVWPGNGALVEFDEELDLHAQPPATPLSIGSKAVFVSAILRRPDHEIIPCEAFTGNRKIV